jgi:Flp pilus assembly protein TadG
VRAILRACRGTAAIEFALLAPPFIMLVLGAVEYGRLLWTTQALQQTAIAGARCMAIPQAACKSGTGYDAATTKSYIQSVGGGWGLSIAAGDITLATSASCGSTASYSQVTIARTFASVVPAVMLLPVGGKSLSASACFPNTPS